MLNTSGKPPIAAAASDGPKCVAVNAWGHMNPEPTGPDSPRLDKGAEANDQHSQCKQIRDDIDGRVSCPENQ